MRFMGFVKLGCQPRPWTGACSAALLIAASAGCGGSSKPSAASVDPEAAAGRAVELYDANSDGGIDAQEAASKCPPLAGAFAKFDADSDGKVTSAEISARLGTLSRAAVGVVCTVTQNGRPLEGAVLKLRPAEMFDDSLLPAQGTTDSLGRATPTVGDEHLPAKLAGMSLMYPGLYHAEITHPQMEIPARYNTATELGCEVDPLSRTGIEVAFDLKP
jgi:hypothetical protein